jgi:PAS domain S-box-containing protein
MLVVAWFYGLRGAVIVSLVSLPVSILMGNLADQTWNISISFMWILATVFRVTLACSVGRLRDVYQNLRNSEAALEAANAGLETQVAIRIEAFSKQQEVISEAQSLAKFGTIQRDLQTGEGWWSDEVYTILGIATQKRALTLEAFLEYIHPHDVEQLKESMATSRKTGYREGEYRVVRSNGEEVTVHSRAKLYFDEEENPVRLIGTILDITERKQAEVKVREAQMELRALSRHLIQAQETERRRIALDLQDRLGQELALLSIEIDQLRQKAPQSQAQFAEQMQKLAVQVRKLSSQVQTLSHRLHPSTLAHLGLVAASKGLCHEVSESSDIQINFSHSDVSKSIPQDVSTCLFRVLQ